MHHHQIPIPFNYSTGGTQNNACDCFPSDALFTPAPTDHSPIIGFAIDGYPIYGPYGYANNDGTGGIALITTSYQERNITTRTTYADGATAPNAGPAVSATWPIGSFFEDYEYVAGSGLLDYYNGRFAVTPEYPCGTYAYYTTMDVDGNAKFPYFIGLEFYGAVFSCSGGGTGGPPVVPCGAPGLPAGAPCCGDGSCNGSEDATTCPADCSSTGGTISCTVPTDGSVTLYATSGSTSPTCASTVNAGLDTELDCTTLTAVLSGSGNTGTGSSYTYQWCSNDGNIVSGTTTLTPTVDAVGTYILYVTDENGFTTFDLVYVGSASTGSTTYYADTDGDGLGDPTVSVMACSQPTGYVTDNTDPDDTCIPSACASCTDGIQNGTETGIDCGGSCPSSCSYVDIIELKAGWNLISTDVESASTAVADVFASLIPGNLLYVTGFDNGAKAYNPTDPPFLNTLSTIEKGFGYWVKVTQDDQLTISGALINASYDHPLDAGWNLVAYVPLVSETPEVYYADDISANNLEFVTGFNVVANAFDPDDPPFLNTLTLLENSFGYWVKVMTATTKTGGNNPTNVFEFVNGQSNLTSHQGKQVLIQNDGGEIIGKMDILADGYLMTTPIYGDDLTTDNTLEGLSIGEEVFFSFEGTLSEQSIVFNGSKELQKVELDFSTVDEASSSLHCYPNPTTKELTIDFYLSEASTVQVVLYDIYGRQVKPMYSGELSKGEQSMQYNLSDLSNGLYLLKVESADGEQWMERVQLVR